MLLVNVWHVVGWTLEILLVVAVIGLARLFLLVRRSLHAANENLERAQRLTRESLRRGAGQERE